MNPLASARPVAIIGAGAIGLSLASAPARAGRSITVCGGRKPIDHIEITEDGIPDTWPVLVAQNGVEQRERVMPYVGAARIVPSVVHLNVERTAPGRAILRRVGALDVPLPDDAASAALAAELNAGKMRTSTEADLEPEVAA